MDKRLLFVDKLNEEPLSGSKEQESCPLEIGGMRVGSVGLK